MPKKKKKNKRKGVILIAFDVNISTAVEYNLHANITEKKREREKRKFLLFLANGGKKIFGRLLTVWHPSMVAPVAVPDVPLPRGERVARASIHRAFDRLKPSKNNNYQA